MKKEIIHLFFIISLCCCCAETAAQNNIYKISDQAYALYKRGQKNLKNPQVFEISDSMYAVAKHLGDEKGMVMSYHLQAEYYTTTSDTENLLRVKDAMRPLAERTGYMQYYFSVFRRVINTLINKDQPTKALIYTRRLQHEAVKYNNTYATIQAYQIMGQIYLIQLELPLSLQSFKKALEYSQINNNKNGEQSTIRINLAILYCQMEKIDEAINELRLTILNPLSSELNLGRAHLILAFCYAKTKQWDAYNKAYAEAMKKEKAIKNTKDIIPYFFEWAQFYYYLNHNEIQEAFDCLLNFSKTSQIRILYQCRRDYFSRTGDYESCYKDLTYMGDYINNTSRVQLIEIQAEYSAEFNQYQIKNQNDRIKTQHAQLKLKQEKDIQNLLEISNHQELIQLNDKRLEIEQRELLLKQKSIQTQIERERILKEQERRNKLLLQEKENEKKWYSLAITASLLLLFSSIYVIFRWRSMNRLKIEKEHSIEAMGQAQEANTRKTAFIQNISHEVRTPLNAIVGFNEILNGDESVEFSPEERKEFIDGLNNNSRILFNLINDILYKSRLESGAYTVKFSSINPETLCSNCINEVKQDCPKDVTLSYKVENNDNITSDKVLLSQILINFLNNACKYTEQGSIELEYLRSKDGYEFRVSDTGKGVPIDKAESIFESFSKADTFTQGTGLGLNIARVSAELLGGRTWLDTTYTHGARFILAIPDTKS